MEKLDTIIQPLLKHGERIKRDYGDDSILDLAHELIVWSLAMDDAVEKIVNALDA